MLVPELLRRSASRTPDALAIIDAGGEWTYASLDRRCDQAARVLADAGVRRGDRVVLAMADGGEFAAAYFGTMRLGAVAVPLPPGRANDRFPRALRDCRPAAAVVSEALARETVAAAALASVPSVFVHRPAGDANTASWERLLDAALPVPPASRAIDLDLAAIVYTSGSTGDPRGVMLSHLNIRSNTESIVEYLKLTASDRVMCVLPFYYVFGLSLLHTHLSVGGTVVVDSRFTFPNVVLAAMQQHRVTGFAGVPSTFALLLQRSNLRAMTFPDLRYVTQAGGAMSPPHLREWLEHGPRVPFYVMYGATEASARLTYLDPRDLPRKLGSIGKAIPNVEIQVLRDDEREAATGEVGELVARGANISAGYWGCPEETAERFGPRGYRTGDLGYADEEGYLFLVGRKHDMIKVGAHRVAPKEIEDVLNEHPAVQDAAVIGRADDLLGEVPVAFLVLHENRPCDEGSLLAFCRERLASHKVPAEFRHLEALPKTTVGKIDKQTLRAAAGQGRQRV